MQTKEEYKKDINKNNKNWIIDLCYDLEKINDNLETELIIRRSKIDELEKENAKLKERLDQFYNIDSYVKEMIKKQSELMSAFINQNKVISKLVLDE